MAATMLIETDMGIIRMQMDPEAAPITVDYISNCVESKLYDGTSFYRSDFVIQAGLYGTNKANPFGNLSVNETFMNKRVSNTRGTAAIAHFDVPDNGNTEFFINLGTNAHLDEVYGGYCVFASVVENDEESWQTVDTIADSIANKGIPKVSIKTVTMC